ncbi:L,D-transpeptidase catalytic domain [Soonwooa buanensis]|uniref:L,D-transpeptidase catalytic domain n=1 Tax=Soonwooa buanensis TaxID=619805 RepID=A0A1T5F2T3_9FLAO|nr:murein L,D-transpeptidase catalytic domain family protein [Soonwooa buanensis]SKB90360.1 L,D-transpeptidase catalytic domain [Soonwooa buanensis]
MRSFFTFFVFLLLLSCSDSSKGQTNADLASSKNVIELKNFLKTSNYDQDLAFLIDFTKASGEFRFFVYDLKNDKILEKGLVAHGSGSEKGKTKKALKFSNVEGSYCSSLGKYVVGESYVGDFGKSYRLYGLDDSNSNVFDRAIVLHKLKCVPDKEQNDPICFSLGCPMLSNNFFKLVEKYIDNSSKRIILLAYN